MASTKKSPAMATIRDLKTAVTRWQQAKKAAREAKAAAKEAKKAVKRLRRQLDDIERQAKKEAPAKAAIKPKAAAAPAKAAAKKKTGPTRVRAARTKPAPPRKKRSKTVRRITSPAAQKSAGAEELGVDTPPAEPTQD